MSRHTLLCLAVVLIVHSGIADNVKNKKSALTPWSTCCDVPPLADTTTMTDCKDSGVCPSIECPFHQMHWLSEDGKALNVAKFKSSLADWVRARPAWQPAVDLIVAECVDKPPNSYLDNCLAYDVFSCATMKFVRKCPKEAWTC